MEYYYNVFPLLAFSGERLFTGPPKVIPEAVFPGMEDAL